jgi:hypothetical protein
VIAAERMLVEDLPELFLDVSAARRLDLGGLDMG